MSIKRNQELYGDTQEHQQPLIRAAHDDHFPWETPLVCKDPSLTIQSEKDNCDINVILARYAAAGEIPTFDQRGVYGDFRNVPSFQEAQDRIALAGEYFDQLPANIKTRFNNNPAAFLDFMDDPEKQDEAIALGLRTPLQDEQAPPPAATPPAPPAPPTGSGTAPGA